MWLSLRRAGRAAVVIIIIIVLVAATGGAFGGPGALEPPLLLIVESALWRAHHDGDLAGLQDLAAPEARLDGPALLAAFARRRARLLPAEQITCEEVDRHGGRSGPAVVELRCALQCRRGDYAVRVVLAPPQPLVLRAPRPALLLGLWLEPAAPEAAGGDGPWWPLGGLPLLAVLGWWRLRRAPGYHG